MHAVDTNVLVRLIVRDDPDQTQKAERFVRKGAWISHLVLVEFSWVLSSAYGVKPAQVLESISMLLNHQSLVIQEADVVENAIKRCTENKGIEFSDCLILEVARKAGHLPVATFDRKLGRQPGARAL